MEALAGGVAHRVSQAFQAKSRRIDQGHSARTRLSRNLSWSISCWASWPPCRRDEAMWIHPRETGQHHGITPVALPFVLIDCPGLPWIGHDHSKTQLLQKAAHPRTVHAGFHHRSGAGITSRHGCELFARIAQTSLSAIFPASSNTQYVCRRSPRSNPIVISVLFLAVVLLHQA